jgi:hypothetical protein
MRKYPIILFFTGIALFFISFVLLATPHAVEAQCGQPTECNTCHNIQGKLPVNENGVWHIDHMPYNACQVCHGGNETTSDSTAAHAGIVTRLDQMQSGCAKCHSGGELQTFYSQYTSQLGISTSIDYAQLPGNASGLNDLLNSNEINISSSTIETVSEPTANRTANWILAGILLVGLVGGGSYVYSNERRLLNQSGTEKSMLSWAWARLRRENWSPYAAGILLGIAGILVVGVGNHLLSASSGIATIASSLFNALVPNAVNDNIYFKFIYPPGFSWPVVLLVGVFIGGLLSALSSGTFHLRWNGDPTWNKVFGTSRWKRFIIGFFGAVILQYGAGIAGGCTSGLAISGGMLLAPSAFLFMAGMFISGILVALLVYRRRY